VHLLKYTISISALFDGCIVDLMTFILGVLFWYKFWSTNCPQVSVDSLGCLDVNSDVLPQIHFLSHPLLFPFHK